MSILYDSLRNLKQGEVLDFQIIQPLVFVPLNPVFVFWVGLGLLSIGVFESKSEKD